MRGLVNVIHAPDAAGRHEDADIPVGLLQAESRGDQPLLQRQHPRVAAIGRQAHGGVDQLAQADIPFGAVALTEGLQEHRVDIERQQVGLDGGGDPPTDLAIEMHLARFHWFHHHAVRRLPDHVLLLCGGWNANESGPGGAAGGAMA